MEYRTQFNIEFLTWPTPPWLLSQVNNRLEFHSVLLHTSLTASEWIGGKLKTSDFEPNEENVGKLAFERWVLMLEGASEAIQSHRVKKTDPEKMANRGLKILGSCILPSKPQHKEKN
jgi:hypothetical protein